MQTFRRLSGAFVLSQIYIQDRKKVFVIGKIKHATLINSIQYLKPIICCMIFYVYL